MRSHNIAIKDRHLATKFGQFFSQYFGNTGFACSRETGEPDTESLLMSRWIRFGKDSGNFRPRKPFRKTLTCVKIFMTHACAGKRKNLAAVRNFVGLDIPIFLRQVNKFLKRNHPHAKLFSKLLQQVLRIIWTVKRFPVRIQSGTGMIAADDEMVGAVVSSNESVPQGFAWSSHAHGQRQ